MPMALQVRPEVLDQRAVRRRVHMVNVFVCDERGITLGRVGGVHRHRNHADEVRRVASPEVAVDVQRRRLRAEDESVTAEIPDHDAVAGVCSSICVAASQSSHVG